jgi:hypothetical protein
MSERLPPGRFTKEQSFSRADNFKNIKSSISDPPICDRPDDTNYVIDHTYALPIATEPYIIIHIIIAVWKVYACYGKLK